MTQRHPLTPRSCLDQLHADFLTLLPRIEAHGRVAFRGLACASRREEAIAEMVGLSWLWFLRLLERGKDPAAFVSALAVFAARQVHAGRRLTGQDTSKDAMSRRAQRRHGFRVEPLPTSTRRPIEDFYGSPRGQTDLDAFEERLHDNAITPPSDAAAFRLDFRSWLRTRSGRDRRLIGDMMRDERTGDLARKYRVSAGRISQLRREYMQDWRRFCGEDEGPLDTAQQPGAGSSRLALPQR
jgi:hypothetical protein